MISIVGFKIAFHPNNFVSLFTASSVFSAYIAGCIERATAAVRIKAKILFFLVPKISSTFLKVTLFTETSRFCGFAAFVKALLPVNRNFILLQLNSYPVAALYAELFEVFLGNLESSGSVKQYKLFMLLTFQRRYFSLLLLAELFKGNIGNYRLLTDKLAGGFSISYCNNSVD